MRTAFLAAVASLTFACSLFTAKVYHPPSMIEAHSYSGGNYEKEYRLHFEPNGHVVLSGRLGALSCNEEWDVEPERFQATAKVIDSGDFFAMDSEPKERPNATHFTSVDLHVVLDDREKTVRGIRVDQPSDVNRKFFAFVLHLETVTDAKRRIDDCFSWEKRTSDK